LLRRAGREQQTTCPVPSSQAILLIPIVTGLVLVSGYQLWRKGQTSRVSVTLDRPERCAGMPSSALS
jgi:hypothetical protein